jgi:hypothetical protein
MYKLALYSPMRSWKKGQPPISPFVSVAVGAYTEADGQLLLTAQLMTDSEIDYEVGVLMKELEEFRKAAKKELRTLKAKMLAE